MTERLISQIINIKEKAILLRAEIIKMEAAGMDTRRLLKQYEGYIDQDIDLTAKLRALEKENETP